MFSRLRNTWKSLFVKEARIKNLVNTINREKTSDKDIEFKASIAQQIKKQMTEESYLVQLILLEALRQKLYFVIDYVAALEVVAPLKFRIRSESPIHVAFKNGMDAPFDSLFQVYPTVNYVDMNGVSHFHIACALGELDSVIGFIEKGIDVNHTCDNLQTPLHKAVKYGQKNIVRLLLQHKADVNLADVDGKTPLHLLIDNLFPTVIRSPHFEMCDIAKILIESKCDINAKDKHGDTPLAYLFNYKHFERYTAGHTDHIRHIQLTLLEMLLTRQEELQITELNNHHQNIFDVIIGSCTPDGNFVYMIFGDKLGSDMIKLILEKGIYVNMKSPWNKNALQTALCAYNLEITETLLRYKASRRHLRRFAKFPINSLFLPEFAMNVLGIDQLLRMVSSKTELVDFTPYPMLMDLLLGSLSHKNCDLMKGILHGCFNKQIKYNIDLIFKNTSIFDSLEKWPSYIYDMHMYKKILDCVEFHSCRETTDYIVNKCQFYEVSNPAKENINYFFPDKENHVLEKEIKLAKKTKINSQYSLYDICKMNYEDTYNILHDTYYHQLVRRLAFDQKFKFLGPFIKGHMAKSIILKSMKYRLEETFAEMMPIHCGQRIISYMEDEEIVLSNQNFYRSEAKKEKLRKWPRGPSTKQIYCIVISMIVYVYFGYFYIHLMNPYGLMNEWYSALIVIALTSFLIPKSNNLAITFRET
ncbi:hypothetical protein TKK_0003587 [Trichogramma kaykai]|uniref:Uncharacterized protein n=1 Tax=Trichogramma kaykai TaxID=54128 RepID=A0ABD2XQ70_9HYME